jgi:hypothetical protein
MKIPKTGYKLFIYVLSFVSGIVGLDFGSQSLPPICPGCKPRKINPKNAAIASGINLIIKVIQFCKFVNFDDRAVVIKK